MKKRFHLPGWPDEADEILPWLCALSALVLATFNFLAWLWGIKP